MVSVPIIASKADIRNPLRYLQDHKESSRKRVPLMIFHERSRFATCQWELSTPTDISIPLTHRLVLRALEAGECLSAFNKIMQAKRFGRVRKTRMKSAGVLTHGKDF